MSCRRRARTTLVIAVAVGLNAAAWGCSGENAATPTSASNTTGVSGAAGTASTGSGRLAVHITDSPFSEAMAVLVTFSEVSVHTADPGEWKTLPFASGATRTCDLKQLTAGATDVLGVGSLAAGKYTQIRLTVTEAALYFDNPAGSGPCAPAITAPAGDSATVEVPSGELKLNHEFTLTSTGSTITLDFDGDQSIHQTGSGNAEHGNGQGNGNGRGGAQSATKYIMRPVIRVVSVQ